MGRSERKETRIIACELRAKKESRSWCLKRHQWKRHGEAIAHVGKNKCSKLLTDPIESKIKISSSKEELDKFEEKADNGLLKREFGK